MTILIAILAPLFLFAVLVISSAMAVADRWSWGATPSHGIGPQLAYAAPAQTSISYKNVFQHIDPCHAGYH
jgi:hypothetical protein